MAWTRRKFVQSAALGSALVAVPTAASAALHAWPNDMVVHSSGTHDYGAAIDAIRQFAVMELIALGLPGMILELADAGGFRATLTLGWADMASRTPVTAEHRFEIGSISKSLTALTLWTLAAEGKVDLNAPLSRYLPATTIPATPITALHLLNHVAGLANGGPIVPSARPWSAASPGAHFYYSNTGYELAGLLIDAITGNPHPEEIKRRVLDPIGMTAAHASIHEADRLQLATGYVAQRQDAAPMAGSPLVEGVWTNMDMAAGSVTATAADMHAYLRYVIGLARGHGAPLLEDADVARLLAASVPAMEFGPGARYSSGFERTFVDARPMLHHTGGMLMFASSFDVDGAAGLGAFASVNAILGAYRPIATTSFAIQAMRAVADGRALPAPPDPLARRRVRLPQRFTGRWVCDDGAALTIAAAPAGGLILSDADASGPVESAGPSRLLTGHPHWNTQSLDFDDVAGEAPFTRFWFGNRQFARDAAPPPQPAPPARLSMLVGVYDSGRPWVGSYEVAVRGQNLVMLGAGEMTEDPDGYWLIGGEDKGFERIRFDTMIGGRCYRMNYSGWDCVRLS